jgi:SAM-dependent methyltransferase
MSASPNANAYDRIPYPGLAFLQTHPDRLAVLGTLFGMKPPAVENCRVLEIACGDGSNLIPMAFGLPRSQFVGVDLAAKPIEAGRQKIRRLGLKNIRIEQMDVLDLEPGFGEFDYIIAHGIYAWVPEKVQKKILAICQANLGTNGVAFVSYNTTPAGHVRQVLREMMQFHERQSGGTGDAVKSGRDFLGLIPKLTAGQSPWKSLFEEECKLMFNRDEKVVYHDDLAECFSPVSFSDFAERAAGCGLQFLSEAQFSDALEPELSAEALSPIRDLAQGDSIAYQQYLDFARYRRFRQTLLCRAGISLQRGKVAERLGRVLVASPIRALGDHADGAVKFENSRGSGTLTTNNPALIAILRRLEEIWPRAESFEDLLTTGLALLPEPQRAEARTGLAKAVLQFASGLLADLRTCNPPFASEVSEKPEASALARLMVQDGDTVTTLLHIPVKIEDEQGRKFLQLLDGASDRQALAGFLCADSPNVPRETVLKQVDSSLGSFYKLGLLVA